MLPQVLPEERAVLQAHAVADFKAFLLLRAEEFRPGGMLVLGYISSHETADVEADKSWWVARLLLGCPDCWQSLWRRLACLRVCW